MDDTAPHSGDAAEADRTGRPLPLAGPPPIPAGWGATRAALWGASILVLLLLPPRGIVQLLALGLAGAAFLWLLWPVETSPKETRRSSLLLIAGGMMLVAPFLYACPWWGSQSTDWPWVQWQKTGIWVHRIDLILWVCVTVLTLLVGFGVRGRRWAPALLVAACFLAARAISRTSGYGLLRIDRLNLSWAFSSAALGGGLLRLAGRGPTGRVVSRWLLLGGALGIVAIYLAWFPTNQDVQESSLALYAREFATMWDRVILGAEHDPELLGHLRDQTWAVVLPFACQVIAVAIAIGLALVPCGPAHKACRWLAALAWVCLLLTFLLPPRAGLYVEADSYAQQGMVKVAKVLGELFMRGGLCAWLVISGALLRVLGVSAAPRPAPLRPELPELPAAPRGPYVVAALLALLVLHASFRPGEGLVTPEGVRALLEQGSWTPALADFVFESVFLLAVLVAALAPVRGLRLGSMVCLGTWVVLWPTSASDQRMYEVEAWVPGLTAAICAAGVGALGVAERRPPGARFLAVACGAVLLGLLVYPILVLPSRDGRPAPAIPPYEGYLPTEVIRDAFRSQTAQEIIEGLLVPWRWVVLMHTGLLGAAFVAAARGRPRLSKWIALTCFGAALAYPALHAILDAAGKAYARAGTPPDSLAGYEQRLAGALKKTHVVYDLALFAAVSTILRPARRAPTLATLPFPAPGSRPLERTMTGGRPVGAG